jgi:hypothetical protein
MSNAFRFLAVWLAVAVLITGSLTALRVRNASQEDMLFVVAMNRIRAAYVAIDPTIAEHLVTGWSDDEAGVTRTYVMGLPRPSPRNCVCECVHLRGDRERDRGCRSRRSYRGRSRSTRLGDAGAQRCHRSGVLFPRRLPSASRIQSNRSILDRSVPGPRE